MKLISKAFQNEGIIPVKYTCDGENMSPPLSISDVPGEAKSLVLIMDDPDVPSSIRKDGIWDHWVVFNIPTDVHEIIEGNEPPGVPGKGTNGETGYFGPCPPDREHRYYFRIYALDNNLDLEEGVDKKTVEKAMKDNIIAKDVLMGRYERQ
jgi:Raf kinase inhibitor-like YbhB/YbcL family protein